MKKAILLVLVLCTGVLYAQDTKVEPTYEAEGNLVAVTNYYEDGSVKETGFYNNEKLHGDWIKYNEDGEKIVSAHYINGVKTGKWLFLNDGVVTQVDYEDNKITNVYEWNKQNSVAIN